MGVIVQSVHISCKSNIKHGNDKITFSEIAGERAIPLSPSPIYLVTTA